MIGTEYDFHNENDYSESDMEVKDEKSVVYEKTDGKCGRYIEN